MATRTDHVMRAAVRATRRAKELTKAAVREAEHLLQEARKEANSEDRRRRRKQTLLTAGRVLRAAGQAALVAGVMAGIAAVRSERSDRKLPKGGAR